MKAFYLGPANTFSHQATKILLVDNYQYIPCASFKELFESVKTTNDSYGIVPFENSITSNVHENIDELFSSSLKIVGELFLEIHLHVLSLINQKLDNTVKILSHPKALEQCKNFIATHNLRSIPTQSTAEAARLVKESKSQDSAFIAGNSFMNSGEYTVLAKNIADVSNNYTRFLTVSQTDLVISNALKNKCSMTFKIKHEEGALLEMLAALKNIGANLTKITSRPIPGSNWEYLFWIDFETKEEITDSLLANIKKYCLEYRVVGIYPSGQRVG